MLKNIRCDKTCFNYSDYDAESEKDNPWSTNNYQYDDSNYNYDEVDITNFDQVVDAYLSVSALQSLVNGYTKGEGAIGQISNYDYVMEQPLVNNVDFDTLNSKKMCLGGLSSSLGGLLGNMENSVNTLYQMQIENGRLFGFALEADENFIDKLKDFASKYKDRILNEGAVEVYGEYLVAKTGTPDISDTRAFYLYLQNLVSNGGGIGLASLAAQIGSSNPQLAASIASMALILSYESANTEAQAIEQFEYTLQNSLGLEAAAVQNIMKMLLNPAEGSIPATDIMPVSGTIGGIQTIVLTLITMSIRATIDSSTMGAGAALQKEFEMLPSILLQSTVYTVVYNCSSPLMGPVGGSMAASTASGLCTSPFTDDFGNIDQNWCGAAELGTLLGTAGGYGLVSALAITGGPALLLILGCAALGYLTVVAAHDYEAPPLPKEEPRVTITPINGGTEEVRVYPDGTTVKIITTSAGVWSETKYPDGSTAKVSDNSDKTKDIWLTYADGTYKEVRYDADGNIIKIVIKDKDGTVLKEEPKN